MRTERAWILARVSLNAIRSVTPGRCTFNATTVFSGPRRLRTACSWFHWAVLWSFTATIRSPVRIPARSAGDSGSGATTTIALSRTSIWMPSPP